MSETTAIAPYEPEAPGDLMWSSAGFEHAQRLAKMFASSAMIPEHLRGKLPDVTIALLMARRLNEDPLVVMQNIHFVKGKAGWNAQYVIARANRSGVFKGRINWREKGKGDSMEIEAYATLAETGEEVAFTASMEMARAEGWTSNSKYKSMPQLMLRYRSATFLVRLFAPEVMLGVPTAEELEAPSSSEAVNRPTGRAALGLQELDPPLELSEQPPEAVVIDTQAEGPAPAAKTTSTPADDAEAPL